MTAVLAAFSGVVTALFTAALAWATYRLVLATNKLAEESARLRDPQLVGRVEPLGSMHVEFVISNIGGGAARNVQLQLTLGQAAQTWRHVVFEPGRTDRFRVPGQLRTLAEHADANQVLDEILSYENAQGIETQTATSFPFQTLRADWALAGWEVPRSDLRDIKKVLDKRLGELVAQLKGAQR